MKSTLFLLTALGCFESKAEDDTGEHADTETCCDTGDDSPDDTGETAEDTCCDGTGTETEPDPKDVDDDGDGWSESEGDCDDGNSAINPSASDIVGDGIDQNCDCVDGTDMDEDCVASTESGGTDCNDSDPLVYPGADEVWYDGVDQQCDGTVDDNDQDGDGYDADSMGGEDCNDEDADISPVGIEINTNGEDDNCNGIVDGFSLIIWWGEDHLWGQIEDFTDRMGILLKLQDSDGETETASNAATNTGLLMSTTELVELNDDITYSIWLGTQCWTWGYDTSLYPDCTEDDLTAW